MGVPSPFFAVLFVTCDWCQGCELPSELDELILRSAETGRRGWPFELVQPAALLGSNVHVARPARHDRKKINRSGPCPPSKMRWLSAAKGYCVGAGGRIRREEAPAEGGSTRPRSRQKASWMNARRVPLAERGSGHPVQLP